MDRRANRRISTRDANREIYDAFVPRVVIFSGPLTGIRYGRGVHVDALNHEEVVAAGSAEGSVAKTTGGNETSVSNGVAND